MNLYIMGYIFSFPLIFIILFYYELKELLKLYNKYYDYSFIEFFYCLFFEKTEKSELKKFISYKKDIIDNVIIKTGIYTFLWFVIIPAFIIRIFLNQIFKENKY